MKNINVTWFAQMAANGIIGIVTCEDEITGEKKAYIGVGEGRDESEDIEHILNTGAKLHLPTACSIVEALK